MNICPYCKKQIFVPNGDFDAYPEYEDEVIIYKNTGPCPECGKTIHVMEQYVLTDSWIEE